MTTTHSSPAQSNSRRGEWLRAGLTTAAAAIVAVLAVQAAALALWPESAAFKPLDSYARSALFTLVPALVATALLAWLAARTPRPLPVFIRIAVIVLALSIIPDYVLPVPHRTLLASTVAAGLHGVAAVVTVAVLARIYPR